jgi:hypothetical protein
MAKFTVLVETRPFCASNTAPMNKLKNSGMQVIDLRGSDRSQGIGYRR